MWAAVLALLAFLQGGSRKIWGSKERAVDSQGFSRCQRLARKDTADAAAGPDSRLPFRRVSVTGAKLPLARFRSLLFGEQTNPVHSL